MAYTAPVIADIVIKGKVPHVCNAVLAWDSMQLPDFLSIKAEIDGAAATRFIALDAIEEMTIANEELYRTMPSSFIPGTRLKAKIDNTI